MVLEDLNKGITFSIGTYLDSKWIWNYKFREARSDLGFIKFDKISRCGLKI
jgi:hypothetical protein